MDLNLNFERIASLSASDEAGLVERVGSENGERIVRLARKPNKRIQKKQRNKRLKSLETPSSGTKPAAKPPSMSKGRPTKLKKKPMDKPGEKPGTKKKRPPKPGSKRALREEMLAKVPKDPDKGKAYCVQQTSPKNGAPMIWVSPSGNRRQFCRSLGPRELRRLRKKMHTGDPNKASKSLRELLRIMKGVRPNAAAGETMGDLAIRRRMRRQLGNILQHGGMSKARLQEVAKGKPQAIKAFKKMMSGRGMGQFGMQDMTDSKKMAQHFDKFMKDWDSVGEGPDDKYADHGQMMTDWREGNMRANKAFRSSKGKKGDGFGKLRAENREIRQKRKQQKQDDEAALADSELNEDPYAVTDEEWLAQTEPQEDKYFDEEPEPEPKKETRAERIKRQQEEALARIRGRRSDLEKWEQNPNSQAWRGQPAASQKLLRSAAQRLLKRRTVTAAVTVTESYDEFNPMVAEGSWKAMQVYAMYRADCHANLDRIAAKAFLLTD